MKSTNPKYSILARISLWTIIVPLLFVTCQQEEFATSTRIPVEFTANLGELSADVRANTRLTGDIWDNGDATGIFMLKHDQALGSGSIIDKADNIRYKVDAYGKLTVVSADSTIYFPLDGNVDFVTYYPQQKLTDYTFNINLKNQASKENLSKADILYARITNRSKTSPKVNLDFKHQMSKIIMKVKAGNGNNSLDLTSTSAGIYNNTEATFDLRTGKLSAGSDPNNITPYLQPGSTTGQAVYEAILIPDNDVPTGSRVEFTSDGNTYTWDISGMKFEPGYCYTYNVTIDKISLDVSVPQITNWTTKYGSGDALLEQHR